MGLPVAYSTLIATALGENCGPDLAAVIVAHPCLTWDAPPLSQGTMHRLFRFAIGADEPGPKDLAFMRAVSEALLIYELP